MRHTSLLSIVLMPGQKTIKTDCGKRVPVDQIQKDTEQVECPACAEDQAWLMDAARDIREMTQSH